MRCWAWPQLTLLHAWQTVPSSELHETASHMSAPQVAQGAHQAAPGWLAKLVLSHVPQSAAPEVLAAVPGSHGVSVVAPVLQ